jgi:hypothetical protein
MDGFQRTASKTPRAAEGVITSYDTRSAFISGRVKTARGPETKTRKLRLFDFDMQDSLQPTIN